MLATFFSKVSYVKSCGFVNDVFKWKVPYVYENRDFHAMKLWNAVFFVMRPCTCPVGDRHLPPTRPCGFLAQFPIPKPQPG
jgi:hypothetical protein